MKTKLRPETTLFMLMSVDGKISTGDSDALDFDQDLPKIVGVKEGLHQYYDLEKKTDWVSMNTGRVMAKIGCNDKVFSKKPISCKFVIIDNKPHLTSAGVEYLTQWLEHLYLVTTNSKHPALESKAGNITVIKEDKLSMPNLFEKLYEKYKIEKITIQSGGTMNAGLIRAGLIDKISLVVAPVIIGGKDTSTLVDGESLHTLKDLILLKPLKLTEAKKLDDSYLLLQYDVING